jgi:formylglycine-generating enzyme required for sulfatase activity
MAGRYAVGDRTGIQEKQQSPVRTVDVCPFQLSANELTTGQFQLFVDDTSYRTDAESNVSREQGRHKAVHFD